MMEAKTIGFVVLSYSDPDQLLRLTRTLTELYLAPPVVCHHNFTQCDLDTSVFPPNVAFVRPHLETGWGSVTTVRAGVQAIKLLYERARPDWFVLLSGSDYPVARPSSVLADLMAGGADAYIDCVALAPGRQSTASARSGGGSTGAGGFNKAGWSIEAFYRYYPSPVVRYPVKTSRLTWNWRERRIENDRITDAWASLRLRPRLFAGDPWFTGSAAAADAILNSPHRRRVLDYLARREIPEEACYQTLLAHSGLRLTSRNHRFTRWDRYDDRSPQWLTVEDLPSIWASAAHFARKFQPNAPVLDAIDAHLGLPK